MVNDKKQSVLMNKDGEFVKVQTVKSEGLKLCAVDSQPFFKEYSVSIEERTKDDKNQVAFRFKHKDFYYSPKVAGEILMLEITTEFTNSHWFEKVNVKDGAYYALKSVDKPTKYLSTYIKGKYKIFGLKDEQNSVQLKDEEEGSSA